METANIRLRNECRTYHELLESFFFINPTNQGQTSHSNVD